MVQPLLLVFLIAFNVSAYAESFSCFKVKDAGLRGCARFKSHDKDCKNGQLAFWEDSCFYKDGEKPVPEIMSLANGALIPADVYKSYSPEAIARSLIYRLYMSNEYKNISLAAIKNPSFDLYKSTQIQIAFKLKNFESIMKSGFLNQYQTGTSNAFYGPELRTPAENELVNAQLEPASSGPDSVVSSLRPKYAFFAPTEPSDFFTESGYAIKYGEIIAVFKDRLKSRATFSPDDSLDALSRGFTLPLLTFKENMHMPFKREGRFYEAQVWGPISFSDVKYLLVNCPGQGNVEVDKMINIMKAAGSQTPVFSCYLSTKRGVSFYAPYELLFVNRNSPDVPALINDVKATYGTLDVSKRLNEICHFKDSCEISLARIKEAGSIAPSQQKFDLSFHCGGNGKDSVGTVSIPSNAGKAKVSLACTDEAMGSFQFVDKMNSVKVSTKKLKR
jgi:hypothetical protein